MQSFSTFGEHDESVAGGADSRFGRGDTMAIYEDLDPSEGAL